MVAKLCGGRPVGLLFDGAVLAVLLNTRRKVKKMEQDGYGYGYGDAGMFESKEERGYTVWPPENDRP